MRALVVTASINPVSGGPTRSCKGLCRSLSQVGVDLTLLALRGTHPFDDPCGTHVIYGINDLKDIDTYDIVHLQGLWDPLLHKVAKLCRKSHKPYMISPRGMLDPWALSVKRWKKLLAMSFYQRGDLRHAAAFHATAQAEAEHIRAQGLTQPIVIAPNGVETPREMPQRTSGDVKTAIFLGRLHPGKGLLTLAEAWARIRPQDWKMKVVGPDTYGHKKDVVAKLTALGVASDWEFVDMVDDVRKWREYRAADLLVHPSVSENFGITIAEGLYAGLPVICTKGTPWSVLVSEHCGWWIDPGVDALAAALKEAADLSDAQRTEMGRRGHNLIVRQYLWTAVCQTMIRGYEQVLKF